MKSVFVNLDSIEKIKAFTHDLTDFKCPLDLVSGRYTVDAKSIMGIFSLDLSGPLQLNIEGTSEEIDAVLTAIKEYIVG